MQDLHVGPGRAPPEISAALREIDPGAELLHLEGRRWWLGVRAPNPAAQDELQLRLAKEATRVRSTVYDPAERALTELRLGVEFRMRQIMAHGFRPIAVYECEGAPGHDVVEDLRIRDFNYRRLGEAERERALKRHVSISERNKPRVRRFAELAVLAAAEAYRFTMRRARGVLVGANLVRE